MHPLLFPNDPVVQSLSEQLDLPPLISTGDVFHDLKSCLVEQQIHYRSTKKIFAKALERAGLERVSLDNFDAFEADGLAPLALSAAKCETVLRGVDPRHDPPLHFGTPLRFSGRRLPPETHPDGALRPQPKIAAAGANAGRCSALGRTILPGRALPAGS